MALDAFLVFTEKGEGSVDIKGETQDDDMAKKGAFELTNWSFGVSNKLNIGSASGGAGAGKAEFAPFHIEKTVDKGSPGLFHTLCVGGHYNQVDLFIRRAGGTSTQSGLIYLHYSFKLVAVAQIGWANGDPAATESIDFEYGALSIKYTPQKKTGGQDKALDAVWSRVKNKNVFDV